LVAGVHCYPSFTAVPERVDAVLVVVPPAEAATVLHEAAQAGIHQVWLQQGAESSEGLKICDELGLTVVSGECILMYAQPTSYHKAHWWLWKVLGRLAA
jgi:predicted CoA-binding protein